MKGPGTEAGIASRLRGDGAGSAGFPFTVVLTAGYSDEAVPSGMSGPELGPARIEFWGDVLRGKFLLREGTPRRLAALIWEEEAGESA